MSMICINGGLCTGCMACLEGRYYDPVDEPEEETEEDDDTGECEEVCGLLTGEG